MGNKSGGKVGFSRLILPAPLRVGGKEAKIGFPLPSPHFNSRPVKKEGKFADAAIMSIQTGKLPSPANKELRLKSKEVESKGICGMQQRNRRADRF